MVQGGLPRHVSQRAACAVCMNALLLTLVGGVRSQGKCFAAVESYFYSRIIIDIIALRYNIYGIIIIL